MAHTLTGGGFDASEDGTGRGMPLVPVVAGTLPSGGRTARSATNQDAMAGLLLPIPFDETQITSAENRSQPRAGETDHPLAAGARPPTIAFNARQDPDPSGDKTHPLDTDGHSVAVATRMTVRRITPTEAARLQGFADDYLNITYRKKPAADGPKYRALGNSKATTVVRWIGDRIHRASKP